MLSALPKDITHVFVRFGMINPEQCARHPAGTKKVNVDSVIRLMEDAFSAGLVWLTFLERPTSLTGLVITAVARRFQRLRFRAPSA